MKYSLLGLLLLLSLANAKIFANVTASLVDNREDKFNLIINIDNDTTNNYNNWDFGFFMFQVMENPVKSPASATICQLNKLYKTVKCSPIVLVVNQTPQNSIEVNLPDQTSGHIMIWQATESSFQILARTKYRIMFTQLNKIPQGISMMPSGLFIRDILNDIVESVIVKSSISTLYNARQNQANNQDIIQQNWCSSESYIKGSSLPIVPKVTYFESKIGFLDLTNNYKINNLSCNQYDCSALKLNPEGYILEINSTNINIYSYNKYGAYYAHNSLSQLLFYYGSSHRLPQMRIVDYPRYPYRGLFIDTVRHFVTTPELLTVIDIMGEHKLNTLHLHLADDEGWRLKLPNYPELTDISSQRYLGYKIGPSNIIDANHDITNINFRNYENVITNYAGYYSESDIRTIIAYANTRGITVIPEIELPGHARAMKKAYPDIFYDFNLSTNYFTVQGYKDNVMPIYKYFNDVRFRKQLDGIIQDTLRIFAKQNTIYAKNRELSVAGDEVPSLAFGSNSDDNLSSKFFTELVKNNNFKISGWQDLALNDSGKVVYTQKIPVLSFGHIYVWQPSYKTGESDALTLLRNKYPVVLDFPDYLYFDLRQTNKFEEPGLYWANDSVSLYRTYSLSSELSKYSSYNNLMGIEAALWGELITTPEHRWYMLLPRMSAMAEVAWNNTSSTNNWQEFTFRLGCGSNGFMAYLSDKYEVNYRGYPNGVRTDIPLGTCGKFSTK